MNRLISRQFALAFALLLSLGGPVVAAEDTHTTHSKQMKNDSGVKDGEEMKDARMADKGAIPSAASKRCKDEGKTHTMHGKQMKNNAGVKDGEQMDNTDCVDAQAVQPNVEKPASKGTHRTHSKQMKNTQGVKDGEPMNNAP